MRSCRDGGGSIDDPTWFFPSLDLFHFTRHELLISWAILRRVFETVCCVLRFRCSSQAALLQRLQPERAKRIEVNNVCIGECKLPEAVVVVLCLQPRTFAIDATNPP